MEKTFVMKPLTEDEINEVVSFFKDLQSIETLEQTKFPRILFNYGRLRRQGKRIEKAEQYLLRQEIKMAEWYKARKEREFEDWAFDFENEHNEPWNYELIKVKKRTDYRTAVFAITSFDEKRRLKNNNTIEVVEKYNPQYFAEVCKKYNNLFAKLSH